MADPSAQLITKRADLAFNITERANAEVIWREIATFMLPNASSFIITGSRGQGGTGGITTTTRLFDGTAIRANRDLASAIDSTLTNSATQWAQIEFESEILKMDNGANGATQWLDDSVNKMFAAFADSNFNTEKASGYEMLTSMGSMALFQEGVDPTEIGKFAGFQFGNISINELAWSENRLGIVDTIYRRMQITAKQAFERFGDKVSEAIISDVEKNPDNLHDFIHCIAPRDPEDVDNVGIIIDELNRPFASVYIERRTKDFVEISGFYEFPVHVVRFNKSPNEQYGRGAGHIALPDTRTLNVGIELLLEATEMAIFPPVITNSEEEGGNQDYSARSFIYMDNPQDVRWFTPGSNLPLAQLSIERLVQQIRESFFLDKIMLPPRDSIGEMSAFETSKRVEEMQKSFGPITGRLEKEFLQPLTLNSFKMMLRTGAFDPIPDLVQQIMAGLIPGETSELKINFINTLSRSQRFEQMGNVRQWIASLQEISVATGSPNPMDRIDTDEVAKLTEEILGVPPKLVRTDKQLEEIREARAQEQQQQQDIDNLNKGADTASKLQ